MRIGLFADEFARFGVLRRRQLNHDTAILRVTTKMDETAWGELFSANAQLPRSFCVMVKAELESPAIKPYTPVEVGESWLDLLVKTYAGGSVSEPLFKKREGESVWMQGPRIKFDFAREMQQEKRLFGIAGGTGIAPIYQVFKAPEVAEWKKHLIFANKTAADKVLESELSQIPNLTVRHVLQDQEGFLSSAHIPPLRSDDLIFLCGPKMFNEHVSNLVKTGKLIKF